MKHPLVAYQLACLLIAGLFVGYSYLVAPSEPPTSIMIRTNADTDEAINAIEGLHLKDAKVMRVTSDPVTLASYIKMTLFSAIGLAIVTGLVLFFYKLFCRWLKIEPRL
jgi:hypothetical protein